MRSRIDCGHAQFFYEIKTENQVVISLNERIDPEDKTEIGKPTIISLEIKCLSIGCGNPKTDRS